MLVTLIFLGLFMSCMGQESSSANPVSSTASPTQNPAEKDGPRNQQHTTNPRPFRNYVHAPAGGTATNQPRLSATSNQARPIPREASINSPDELRNPSPSRANPTPNEPAFQSFAFSPRSQQPPLANQARHGQLDHRYRSGVTATQPRRTSSSDQPAPNESPSQLSQGGQQPRQAQQISGRDQLGYSYQPEVDATQPGRINPTDQTTRNAPTFQSGQISAGRQQPRQVDQAPGLEYRFRPAVATQPRSISSPDQTSYQASNSDEFGYKPYSFNYVSEAEDGYYTHQQSADDTGKVIGSYSFALDDGRKRVVEYIADQNGFRANIDTNEPGTSMQENPADVVYYSTAPISTRPATRSFDSARPVQDPGYNNAQGVPTYTRRVTTTARRPEVVTYHGFGVGSGNALSESQGSEIESSPVRPTIRNYQGQISGRSDTASSHGRRFEYGTAGITSYQPLDIERGPAYSSFLGSTATIEGPRAPNYRGYGSPEDSFARPDANTRGLEPAAQPEAETYGDMSSTRDARGNQNLDSQPTGQGPFQPERPQHFNPRHQSFNYRANAPVAESNIPYPLGSAPFYYYIDSGNLWDQNY